MELIITNHASDRLKERVGLKSQREKETYVLKAYCEGLRENDCSGISLKLIKSRKKVEYGDRDLVLYRDQIFVFDENRLITVLPLDKSYRKVMDKTRCRRNKKTA